MSHMTNLYISNVPGWIAYDIFGLHMTNLMGIDIFMFTIFGTYDKYDSCNGGYLGD